MTALAERLTAAEEAEHGALLDRCGPLPAVELAHALKDACYAAWSSDPRRVFGAAAALAALARAEPWDEVQAIAAWAAGIAALVDGRMEQAVAELDAAAARIGALGKPLLAATTQVAKLMALAMLGQYDEAAACGLAARDVFLAYNDELSAGKVEQNLGNIAYRRDRYAEAERYYRLAHGRFLAVGDQAHLARVESGLADVLKWRHQFTAARRLYEHALARATTAGLAVIQAEAECNLGNLALLQGRYDQALDYLERSRRRYAVLSMPHESAYADLELAEAYLELNLTAEAAAIYARVIPVFASLGMRAEHAWALAHDGRTAILLGRHEHARRQFVAARELFDAEGNGVSVALVTLFEAQLLYHDGEYEAAAAAAAAAGQVLAAADSPGRLPEAGWLCGEALRSAGRLDEARAALDAALQLTERARAPQIAHRCHTSLGLLGVASGDLIGAEAHFRQAVTVIEALRAPLPGEEVRTAFFADKLRPFSELARLCLASDRLDEALGFVERARSRALMEMLGGAAQSLVRPLDSFEAGVLERITTLRQELNWCYARINRSLESEGWGGPAVGGLKAAAQEREAAILELNRQLQLRGGGALAAGHALDLAQFRAVLADDTALVEFYSLDGELLAFVVTDCGVAVVRNLGGEAEIAQLVDSLRFQTDAMGRGIGREGAYHAQLLRRTRHYLARLYDLLLRPILPLVGERRLAVVPDGSLHYVPFRALFDGTHYLIETREVCTAPSAAVLYSCLVRPESGRQRAVLLGVPDERTPRVRDEILAIAPLWPERVVALDEQATAEALRQHAPEAGVLHLACHGHFRPDSPLFSSLRLADGWFTARDAYALRLDCNLVVLSGCETGVSAQAPGDELIGLARGFFAAGAPSLLVSLWTVDDTSTAELMTTFYERLKEGDRPAAALRQAQCALMRERPHPYFWAPFVLMGRW